MVRFGLCQFLAQLLDTATVLRPRPLIQDLTRVAGSRYVPVRQEGGAARGARDAGRRDRVERAHVDLLSRTTDEMGEQREATRVTKPERRPLIGEHPHLPLLLHAEPRVPARRGVYAREQR